MMKTISEDICKDNDFQKVITNFFIDILELVITNSDDQKLKKFILYEGSIKDIIFRDLEIKDEMRR
mgnify:FL=1